MRGRLAFHPDVAPRNATLAIVLDGYNDVTIPANSAVRPGDSFQLGLRFASGRPKPGIYSAFRMPAFVRLVSARRVEIFGGLRTAAAGTEAVISSRRGSGRYR